MDKLQFLKLIIEGVTSSKNATRGMQGCLAEALGKTLPEILGNTAKSVSKEKSVAEILGYESKMISRTSVASTDKAVKVSDEYVKELMAKGRIKDVKCTAKKSKMKKFGDEQRTAIKPVETASQEVRNEAFKVVPPRELSAEEKKIKKIKQLMHEEKSKYKCSNAAFRQSQRMNAQKFNEELDEWSIRYSEAVGSLDKAKAAGRDTAVIEQSIKNIEKNAEKNLREQLKEMKTLSPAEIEEKIQEAKNYMQIRVQNATYKHATMHGTVNNAWALLGSGFEEFKSLIGTRIYSKMTPEQLKFMIDSRVRKIERLVLRAKVESKLTVNPMVELNGMKFPIKISLAGTSKTDEIAKITGGKSPEEALKYYKELKARVDKACTELKRAKEIKDAGYVQLKAKPIEFPIRDLEKSDKLKWYEAQLQEKQRQLAKIQANNSANKMIAKNN